MDPSVSDPMLNPTSPAAVAAPGPAEDPLEPVSGFHGLRVIPWYQLCPFPSAPSDSLPTSTAPASLSLSTTVASVSIVCSL